MGWVKRMRTVPEASPGVSVDRRLARMTDQVVFRLGWTGGSEPGGLQ